MNNHQKLLKITPIKFPHQKYLYSEVELDDLSIAGILSYVPTYRTVP